MSTATEDMPVGSLSIKKLSCEELLHVIMLAHRIWPTAYEGILTTEQIDNMLARIYTRESLQKEMDDGHQFWITYAGVMPVAYASAYKDDTIVWIKKLYVDPTLQGKRIGTNLMHAAVSELMPASEIRLLANPNNIPAHNYYISKGFTKIGEVPVMMGDWRFNDFLFSMPLTSR